VKQGLRGCWGGAAEEEEEEVGECCGPHTRPFF
jgi:hypothetical protein